jgi:RNA polymerase sigma-70 factor (ECF subfamily)
MSPNPPTRASLLLRIRDPEDDTAWREFVDLYTPLVWGYARNQGLQDADAADLTQEVLTAIARSIARLDYDPARGTFRSWLFTIVRRKLTNRRAAFANQVHGSGDSVTVQRLAEQPDTSAEEVKWEREWEQRVFAWACEQVRREVSDATWQAFWRAAFEGRPSKQVAAELGLNLTTVYNARSRVLARLKELVQAVQEP